MYTQNICGQDHIKSTKQESAPKVHKNDENTISQRYIVLVTSGAPKLSFIENLNTDACIMIKVLRM